MTEPSHEELLSAEFDELTSADQSVPRSPQDSETLQQWRHLGDCLRALPTGSCGQFSAAVRSRIELSEPEMIGKKRAVSPAPVPHIRRDMIALLTAAAAIAVVTVPISFLVMQTDSASVTTMSDAGGDLPYASAPSNSVLPANSRDWQVVVVTVSEQKHAEVSSRLRQSIGHSGLEIQSLSDASVDDDQTMGVLISSADTSLELLDALDTGFRDGVAGDIQTEWNPERVGNYDRDELLTRLTESMKTPTRSDVYFGEIFVVVPTNETLVAEAAPLKADADKSIDSVVASAVRSRAGRTNSESAAEHRERVGSHPVLVLFQKKPASEDSQGENGPRHGRGAPLSA
jgi:hypothetical protein